MGYVKKNELLDAFTLETVFTEEELSFIKNKLTEDEPHEDTFQNSSILMNLSREVYLKDFM